MPLTGLRRKWLWPNASPEGEFEKNSQLQEGWYEGGENFQIGHLPTTQLEHKMPTHVGIDQMSTWRFIPFCFFLTLHHLHIYKWYIDNFLKRRLHPSSSYIYLPHIAKQNYILLFFSFPPFRGLATKCGSAMLKPKGVSDCVPKCLLLVTLWKGKPRYKFLGAKHKAVRHWQGKYLRHAIRLSILSTVLYYKYSDTSKQHASNQHLHNNTSTDNWKSLFFLRWAIHGVHKVSLWHLCSNLFWTSIWTPSSVNPRKLHNSPNFTNATTWN